MVGRFISFPITLADVRQQQHAFYQICHFPGVIGVIDGTHIQIIAPSINEPAYVNRHHYHSINTQVVFDSNDRIVDVVARWPALVSSTRQGLRQLSTRMTEIEKPVENAVKKKLTEAFKPKVLEVINESFMHNVPKGSESHFKVVVVSERFASQPLIKRHRMVNEVLQDELSTGRIHALSIMIIMVWWFTYFIDPKGSVSGSLLSLDSHLNCDGLPDDHFHLGVFTDRRGTYRCLKKEGEHHLSNDNMDYAIQLEIWKGNIGRALQIARERDELSDWLVGLAPLASHETWLSLCEEYALQLETDGQYHKAASYLLASHKVYEAIDLFKRHRLFKEAVSLARVRLSPLDPVLEDLYTEWAQALMKDGNYEQAAKCYLAMKQIQDAANMITKRTDQMSLRTATHMTLLANEKPQSFLYAHRLVHQFIAKDDWKQGYKFLKEHEMLKTLLPFVSMHECVLKALQDLSPGALREVNPDCFTQWKGEPTGKTFIPEFILDTTDCDPVLPWKPYMIGEHSFPHHVLKVWHCDLDIAMDSESLTLMYRTLHHHQSGRQSHIDPQQLMFQVCMDLTLSLLAILIGDTSASISHMLHAIATLHTVSQFTLMEAVCQLMLPLGPKYLLKLQQEATALRVLISMETHHEVEGAGKTPAIKRYLSEIKEGENVSTSGLRCRELDCLRAYYYLAVLHFLKQSIRAESFDDEEEESVDDDSKVKASQEVKVSQDLAQTSRKEEVPEGNHIESIVVGQSVEMPSSGTSAKYDSVGKETNVGNLDPNDGDVKQNADSAIKSESDFEKKEKLTSESQNNVSVNDPSSMNGTKEEIEVEGVSGDSSKVTDSAGEKSALNAADVAAAVSNAKDEQCSQSSECQNHQKLTISKLKQISQGLLWDIQAKKYSLTETLGYIHKAISKLLLADKSKDCPSVVLHPVPLPKVDPAQNQHDSTHHDTSNSEQTAQFPTSNGLPGHLYDPSSIEPPDIASYQGPENFTKSRKVLWEDEPLAPDNLDLRPRNSNCFQNPAKYINVPDEWYGLPVDDKYFHGYVTMAVLKEEQEYVMHELRRIPEASVVSFPNPFDSANVLLDVCRRGRYEKDQKSNFINQLALWALHFAVTSSQRMEFSKLLTESPQTNTAEKSETSV